jgi:hypothetical protein
MTWAKFAAAGNFLCAAAAAFLAYGLFLGEARAFFPSQSDGELTLLMVSLTIYTIGLMTLGGLLIRGYPIAGPIAAVMHVVTILGGFYLIEMKGSGDLVRQLPRLVFQTITVLLNVKATFALARFRRTSEAG